MKLERLESDLGLDTSIDFDVSIRFDLDLPKLAIRIMVATGQPWQMTLPIEYTKF